MPLLAHYSQLQARFFSTNLEVMVIFYSTVQIEPKARVTLVD